MEIAEILNAFKGNQETDLREAVDAAVAMREEITPHLIAILQNICEHPDEYIQHEEYVDHIYALVLLAYFQESTAHDVIVELFGLPDGKPSEIFSDLITETLPIVLLRTCGGRVNRIKDLALNRHAYEYCRGSALQALSYAAAEGFISRDEALEFYRGLFTGDEAPLDSVFHDIVATCIYDLYPEELMPVIEKAYAEELIWPGYISLMDFHQALESGREEWLEKLRAKIKYRQIENIHDYLSWRANYRPQGLSESQDLSFSSRRQPVKKKDRKARKLKRKRARASRKRNRKRKK